MSANGAPKSVLLGSGDKKTDIANSLLVQELQRRRVRLRRLLPKLDALCVWKRDIEERIADAEELFEHGCLYQDQLEALQDAVASWRLTAARVVLDDEHDMREVMFSATGPTRRSA